MNVPSYEFLAFVALVALLSLLASRFGARPLVMLAANLAFVFTFARTPLELVPFAAFVVVGFVVFRMVRARRNAVLFAGSTIALVLGFAVLKRYAFLPAAVFVPEPYLTIGLSYVVFRMLALVIDAYDRDPAPRVGVLAFFNYALDFSCLVAGPIQLYDDYARDRARPFALDWSIAGAAFGRIVTGFFKVSVLSPPLLAAHAYLVRQSPASSLALAVAVYPVYLYVNFSGYTDVVIGAARFLGSELPENFNRPFAARGFLDFWGRWHMSLANWIKPYVYSPLVLALMRRFPSRRGDAVYSVVAYFVAFFIVGLWHGRTSTFVVLGLLLGLGVSVNKLFSLGAVARLGRARYARICAFPAYAAASRGVTFTWFALSSIFFWASWSDVRRIAASLGPVGAASGVAVLFAGATLTLWLPDLWRACIRALPPLPRIPAMYWNTAWYSALVVMTLGVTVALDAPAPQIVYRAF